MRNILKILMVPMFAVAGSLLPVQAAAVTGELRIWHRITVSFTGPQTSESATPNPFTDYRLNVTFTNGSKTYVVPGFYAADGNAGETSASSGSTWCARFTPDLTGTWTYTASFRTGTNIAITADAGIAGSFDGETGSFTIGSSNKTGSDFRGKGMLRYIGEHHMQFAGSGEYFIKGGADSPEDFLAYWEFDQTPDKHHYSPHSADWQTGDPTWQSTKGKNIIGALNYLAGKGMNSVYFLTMNATGDGNNVWPWTSSSERYRFDCSKLDQWETVFTHMDKLGLMLHIVTQETENDQLLDGGNLGNSRKLYYRELIARFGHHPAVNWNLGEENTNTDQQRKDFAKFFKDNDPYDHLVVIHTYPGQYDEVYNPLLGYAYFDGPSLQTTDCHSQTITWIDRSATNGRKWVVCLDEVATANAGVLPDANDATHNDTRKNYLWANMMAGGGGCEWYFGYSYPHSDLTCEDWRSRDNMWTQTKIGLDFFYDNLPFWQMIHDDSRTSSTSDFCFSKAGDVYAVYLKDGGTTNLNLTGAPGTFDVRWYDPRNGGSLQNGSVTSVTGGGTVALGNAPNSASSDWAVVVTRQGYVLPGLGVTFNPQSVSFTVNEGAANPSQGITIAKRGTEPLPTLQAQASASWIQAAITGSGESQGLTVTANLATLQSGTYSGTVTVTGTNLPASILSVSLRINGAQRAASIAVTPSQASVRPNATQQFAATVLDQFGATMTSATIEWSTTYGSIGSTGLYQAPGTVGTGIAVAKVAGTAIADTSAVSVANSQTSSFYMRGMDGTLTNGMASSVVAGSLAPSVISGASATGSSGTQPDIAVHANAFYTIDVAAGHWYAWARINAPDDVSNSFWIQVDGGTAIRLGNSQTFGTWVWERNQGVAIDLGALSAGTHTITITSREAGCRLDMLCLTPDAAYVPSDGLTAARELQPGRSLFSSARSAVSTMSVYSLDGKLIRRIPAISGVSGQMPGGVYLLKTPAGLRRSVSLAK